LPFRARPEAREIAVLASPGAYIDNASIYSVMAAVMDIEACEVRAGFAVFLRAAEPDLLTARPIPTQWSAVENLRHLIFAEDLYLNRWLLQNNEPWCKLGLLPAFLADDSHYADVGSQPCEDIETLLAAWEAIHTRMMAFVARVTTEELQRDTSQIDFGQGTAGKILQGLAMHDLEHIRQAEAALAAVSQPDGG